MIHRFRGAAYAVAALLLAASTAWADPVRAVEGVAVPVETPWTGHADAETGASDLGLNDEAPARPSAQSPAQAPRSLDERIAGMARAEPVNREEDCLASAVYFEARGESLEGQLAVAEVVMNRAASGLYPASLCGVVAQPAQFSFVRRGVIPRANRGSEAWSRAVGIARLAREGAIRMLPGNVLWYHANYVSPRWGRRLERAGAIGAHIFYAS